jgi:hypothetical protein
MVYVEADGHHHQIWHVDNSTREGQTQQALQRVLWMQGCSPAKLLILLCIMGKIVVFLHKIFGAQIVVRHINLQIKCVI